ncbi:MAG: universal stress protein [Thermodesulfovibrionia bacterium]|nr:universal stress protein [Thermodesulfovibrionia bacterium]
MDMYKKVVLAVDGSEASSNAVKHAVELAKNNKGTLIALYVIPPIDITDIETFKPEMLREALKQEGEKILADIKELAGKKGVEIQTRIEEGIPDEKICEVAGDSDADLIIMGSHGRTGFGKVFIGSVTERVISKEKCCPVLVVR